MSTLHSLFEIRNFILRVLPCNLIYLVEKSFCQQFSVSQWLACWAIVRPIRVRVPASALFLIMFIMVMGTITFHSLSSFCIFFVFFLLLLTFQKGRSAVGFSTCYDRNCLLLRNTCSQCLIVNLATSFHILVQMFVYSCTMKESITKFVCAIARKIPLC
jgi:hypothetical protein